jgi:hypothetical protein
MKRAVNWHGTDGAPDLLSPKCIPESAAKLVVAQHYVLHVI